MSRRIDIELTSAKPDGTWTWRAAGARQPKGVLDGTVLYEGAKAGDVVRAEADFEIDGITILSVAAPREKRAEPQRLEIVGSSRPETPGVTTQLVGRRGRGPGEGRRDQRGPGDRRRDQPEQRSGGGERRSKDGDGRPGRPDGPHHDRSHQDERSRQEGGSRSRPDRTGEAAGERRQGENAGRAESERGRRRESERRGQSAARGQAGRPASSSTRTRARRLSPGNAHRSAVLASLSPEERAVAEQVLRGGIPAVRTALHLEREKAAAEGRPAPDSDALVTLAEQLLPRLRTAEWHDRADAAVKAAEDISMRDLRAVVAGADAARDDETRALASTLREALERRQTQVRTTWVDEVRGHLDAGRTVRAVRLAGRPPEASTRLPAEVVGALVTAAGAAMAPDTPPDRWLAMLEAVADSPIRREVRPAGLPPDPGPELARVARQQSGRVPALADLLGISIPPPPGPRRPVPPPPSARPTGEAGPVAAAPADIAAGGPEDEARVLDAPASAAAGPEAPTPGTETSVPDAPAPVIPGPARDSPASEVSAERASDQPEGEVPGAAPDRTGSTVAPDDATAVADADATTADR